MNPTLIKKLQDFFRKNPITVGIGDIRIYGLKNAELVGDETFVELTNDFKEQMSIEAQQYVISVDDMRNPILIDTATREVILYNHDIGAYEKLFNSLEELILSKLELAN